MKARYEGWGWNLNLAISWAERERGTDENGHWESARALVWSRNPIRLLASVYIRDMEYVINTERLFGLTEKEREALETHFNGMGMRKRPQR